MGTSSDNSGRERKAPSTLIRCDLELARAFKQIAKANHRSATGEMNWLLERHIASYRRSQERKRS